MAVVRDYEAKAQDIKNVEKILREQVLLYINEGINVNPAPLMEIVRKEKLTANKARRGVSLGIGGGFGMSEERYETPRAHAPVVAATVYESKDAYNEIEISEKAIRLGSDEQGSLDNIVARQAEAVRNANAWNMSRMLYGSPEGILCNLATATSASSAKIKVDDVSKLIIGLAIDIHAKGATPESENSGEGPAVSSVQIIAIDYDTNEVLLNRVPKAVTEGFITVQNSFGRELTGLKSIFDPKIDTIYGVKKADAPWIKPYTKSAANDIDDTKITDAIMEANRRTGAKIDNILAGKDAFNAFEYRMKEAQNNITIVNNRKFVGGSAGYEILAGNQVVTIVRDDYVPATEMWGVEANNLALYQTGWDYCVHHGNDIFTLLERQSVYRALMANYAEFVVENPGKCVRITDAASA
jgi:hypothetical protein